MNDRLLEEFFKKERWEEALDTAVEKKLNRGLLKSMCGPDERIRLLNRICNNEYHIESPHTAEIPKDDGGIRTVYINTDYDRIVLAIINQILFDMCPEMIHPRCMSYQKGIGCSNVVRKLSNKLPKIQSLEIGKKLDLSKYFDSVKRNYIHEVFDQIEEKYGHSAIIDICRDYYDNDKVIHKGKEILKYTSLKQGCAVASFLADAMLYNVDAEMDKLCKEFSIEYYRYSDDCIIVGEEVFVEKAFNRLTEKLAEKELTINPKKTKVLKQDEWFEFLGFSLKNNEISLSRKRLKSFEKAIKERTILKSHSSRRLINVLKSVNNYLYKGDYSWCKNVLSVINNEQDIQALNGFVMDAIRASVTNKKNIGGLGSDFTRPDRTILRGKGKNVKANIDKMATIPEYKSLMCMKNIYITNKEVFQAVTRTM